jgi:Peptidase family M28
LITSAQLRDYLEFLASDEMEGRDTPSRGLDTAARFLSMQLSRSGVGQVDDGRYFQTIALTRRRVNPAKTEAAMGARSFKPDLDFIAAPVGGTAEGRLVFVGHGYVIPSKNLDPYKGLDVKGKILVTLAGLPEGVSRSDLRGEPGDKWRNPQSCAVQHGASGIVIVPDVEALASWSRDRQQAVERGAITADRFAADRPAAVPSITASVGMVSALFEGEQVSGRQLFERAQRRDAGDAFALSPGKTLRIVVAIDEDRLTTQNVVAVVEGSDAGLKSEYVAVGAHYDHVGIGGEGEDRIFNGADDDASGTSALLAIAEAMARVQPRPKRSVLFIWHAGEEHDLLGSRYFTRWPTVPLEQIVALLNVDMIGRSRAPGESSAANANLSGAHELYVIGSRMMSSQLATLAERANDRYLRLSFNYMYDDPRDAERLFYRSDHYNYARKGIPIIFYFSGLHEDYHRPSDEVSRIDFAKLEKVTRTIYATALAIADAPVRPRVDKALPDEITEP